MPEIITYSVLCVQLEFLNRLRVVKMELKRKKLHNYKQFKLLELRVDFLNEKVF